VNAVFVVMHNGTQALIRSHLRKGLRGLITGQLRCNIETSNVHLPALDLSVGSLLQNAELR
jgi:hypothetical protein